MTMAYLIGDCSCPLFEEGSKPYSKEEILAIISSARKLLPGAVVKADGVSSVLVDQNDEEIAGRILLIEEIIWQKLLNSLEQL